eukprot:EG_transcript_29234
MPALARRETALQVANMLKETVLDERTAEDWMKADTDGIHRQECGGLIADIDIVEMQGSKGYGVVYSMADISTSMGMIMGPLLGSLLSGLFSFQLTCQAGGALCLSSLVCSYYLRHLGKDNRGK